MSSRNVTSKAEFMTEFMMLGTRQRLARQKCDETDISLNGQSVKHRGTFKYLDVVLDDTLSFNDHVDYVRMKVSKPYSECLPE